MLTPQPSPPDPSLEAHAACSHSVITGAVRAWISTVVVLLPALQGSSSPTGTTGHRFTPSLPEARRPALSMKRGSWLLRLRAVRSTTGSVLRPERGGGLLRACDVHAWVRPGSRRKPLGKNRKSDVRPAPQGASSDSPVESPSSLRRAGMPRGRSRRRTAPQLQGRRLPARSPRSPSAPRFA